MSKAKEEPKPTRHTIENLLKEIGTHLHVYNNPQYQEMDEEIQELTDKLLDNPELKKLRKKQDALRHQLNERYNKTKDQVRKIRQMYQVSGITPTVLKALEKLVEEVNK